MIDWVVVSSLGTAVGTLVLAGATFASVRSANQSARVTERALLARIRPILVPSRLGDPAEKVGFMDRHWVKVEGQRAAVEVTPDAIYLAFTLRNAGAGIAVLDRWYLDTEQPTTDSTYGDPEHFTRLSRDIYIPAGDLGFWQGAFRDPNHERFIQIRDAIEQRQTMTVDLLYEDHEGGQRAISRFALIPGHEDLWMVSVVRHWNLDRDDPR